MIVGEETFGSGSSRERAPKALKVAGVNAVIADSFSRLFYRNRIAIGLPVNTCSGVSDIVLQGDRVSINFDDQSVCNMITENSLPTEPMPPAIQSIFDAGGLLAHYERYPGRFKPE
ncbi:3-isopropylmalate dehydratase small subunit [Halalkalicoccus salilacus]|uniref:hypothetical protein n=1 Tax=Halalkalicoccus TaxID=332246 RepID=UPI002F96C88A